MVDEKIVCAGFSGQGVMSIGQLLAYGGMSEDLEVSWVPSYGPEMRGGTANCSVMLSERPIGSPIVAGDATAIIVLNSPSLQKFEPHLVPGGRAFINSTLVDADVTRGDVESYRIPASEIGESLGSSQLANMVLLGAYLSVAHPISLQSVVSAMEEVFHDCDASILELKVEALKKGFEYVKRP